MKVELQNGDRIQIPEGCKAQINGNEVVIEKENEDGKFKEGDVLMSSSGDCMVIFEKYKDAWRFNAHYNDKYDTNTDFNNRAFRHATEEEKQLIFDKMREEGLRWNAEEKRVEKIRWRAKEGEDYWYISSECTVIEDTMKAEETMIGASTIEEWKNYNHFRTEEQAEKAAEVVKEALRKFHYENG